MSYGQVFICVNQHFVHLLHYGHRHYCRNRSYSLILNPSYSLSDCWNVIRWYCLDGYTHQKNYRSHYFRYDGQMSNRSTIAKYALHYYCLPMYVTVADDALSLPNYSHDASHFPGLPHEPAVRDVDYRHRQLHVPTVHDEDC